MDTDTLLCHWQQDDVRLADVLAAADRLRRRQERTATRAAVLNLAVVAGSDDDASTARSLLDHLGAHHPGRIIVVVTDDGAGPRLDGGVELHHSSTGERCLWWEVVTLRAAGAVAEHLDSLVEPLLIHDLHVVAWYPGDAPGQALRSANQVVVGGLSEGDDVAARALRVASIARSRPVADLAWLSNEPVRAALAGLFGRADRRALLAARPAVAAYGPPWPRALLAGWAMERLGVPAAAVELAAGDEPGVGLDFGDGQSAEARWVGGSRVVAIFDDEEPVIATAGGTPAGALGTALGRTGPDRRYDAALARVAEVAA